MVNCLLMMVASTGFETPVPVAHEALVKFSVPSSRCLSVARGRKLPVNVQAPCEPVTEPSALKVTFDVVVDGVAHAPITSLMASGVS